MLVHCPSCDTKYNLPENKISPAGRQVRCTQCSHVWLVTKPGAEPPQDDFVPRHTHIPTDDEEDEKPTESSARLRQPSGLRKAAAGILVVLGVLYFARGPVVAAWEPAAAIYDLAGAPVPVSGAVLNFDGVQVTRAKDEKGGDLLVITGKIHNPTHKNQSVPQLQGVLLNSSQKPIQTWGFDPPADHVGAEQDLPFHTEIMAPEDARRAQVTFLLD